MFYGYCRVSSREQNEDRQIEALKTYEKETGIILEAVFTDKSSGKNFDRTNYQYMKKILKPGDTFVVKELDRLGRNDDYEDIKREIMFFNSQNISVVILDLPTFNNSDPSMNRLMTNLMIELLSYIAHKERLKITSRVREGLAAAKENGVKLGRPKFILPKSFEKHYTRWDSKEINASEFAKILGVGRTTLYRYIKYYSNSK